MGVITTSLGSMGPSSGNTYIQSYWGDTLGYGHFIYKWDLICINNQLTLKGIWGTYRCHFPFVDVVVSGWENIFFLYSMQSVDFFIVVEVILVGEMCGWGMRITFGFNGDELRIRY